jgi:hypothetical protein
MECPACHHRILTDEQLDDRIRRTVAAYQNAHGLLTAVEVLTRRKAIGLRTQQAFVDAAPAVAIATLKRLEAGQHVQDTTIDFVLRKEFEQLEQKHAQRVLFEMLEKPRQHMVIYSSSWTITPSGGWLQNAAAALPLAACVTLMASTSVPARHGDAAWKDSGAVLVGEPWPC